MINEKAVTEFFKISPTPSLVILPDAPKFTVIEVNNSYLELTHSKRADLIGKSIFESFPENENYQKSDGFKNLKTSLTTVFKTKKSHKMAIQKHVIPIRGTSKFEVTYLNVENIPFLGNERKLQMIVHTVIDVTESVKAKKELAFQNEEKENRSSELIVANKELTFQNEEKGKRADELVIAKKEKKKKTAELKIANEESRYEKNRSEELTEAYKAIEESNERFEYVTKATFDAIWDWNIVTDTIYWGEGFEKIFNHKISDLETGISSWIKNIHPKDLDRITDSYYTIVKSTESNWMQEYCFRKGDGSYAFVINNGIIIRDINKRAIRIIGAMHDITKQKQEERRLKLLESVITNTTDSVLITEAEPFDQPGPKILFVNEAFTKMTGYTAEELIGKTPRMLQGPKTDKEEIKKLSAALRRWESYEVTLLNYKKNGEEFWVNMAISPVANETGWFTHWIAIERDVTEKIKQEQELAEINQKLFNTLDSIQDGFYTLDENWNVTYWNREAERISGKSQQEVIGKNIWELYEGQISTKIYAKFHKAKEQNKPIRLEVFSKMQNKWFELNAFPSSLGLTVYFKDITERKQTEAKLKKMNRALEVNVKQLAISNEELEQFAYVASHDLQEPLRMVTGFLTQIEKKYEALLDEKGKKYIFFAVDGAKRMRQIILDLLEFSRSGKKENLLEEINLNDIVDEIVLLFRKQIEEKKAKINYEILPNIKNYSAPIKQIFQNLISNSLKYSKSHVSPVITITSKDTAVAWKFVVQDNGIGIDPEYFDKIFVIFQRLHNKDDYAGTGIGLAITKKIVENLGGQIWVESQEGIGSAFHFTIPKKQIKK